MHHLMKHGAVRDLTVALKHHPFEHELVCLKKRRRDSYACDA